MNWKQRGSCTSVLEVVTRNSGLTENELLHPQTAEASTIQNLAEAAKAICSAVANGNKVYVMGDYDADGITSSAILYSLLRKLGCIATVRLPHRMSEGYGLKEQTVAEFDSGLLITVDNGIMAHDAIRAAKDKGMYVVILDHHLPSDTLPCADVVVDPHVAPEANGFVEYCGAGLAYKLCQLMYPTDVEFLTSMEAIAAIGTIADAMPLIGDNRVIVKNGLKTLQEGKTLLPGVKALLRVADICNINETDVGFKIGPMLNAAGRVVDDGAMVAFKTLIAENVAEGIEWAEQLNELNEQRKTLTAEAERIVNDIIEAECLYCMVPLCVYAHGIPEGIVGIITGRLAEKYKTPTFVLTDSDAEPHIYKGSGRSYGDYDLTKVLEAARPYLLTGGGHAGAAGISVSQEHYVEMVNAMQSAMEDYEIPTEVDLEYDMVISNDDLHAVYTEVEKYAPYGQHNPRPVFRIDNVMLSPRRGETAKYMGKSMEHLKLFGKQYSIVAFGCSEEYKRQGCPTVLDIVGNLSFNYFRFASELQVEAQDFQPHHMEAKKPTTLLEALRANGAL